MSANRLYHTWFEQIGQLLPDERITRLRNFVWLMVGIYQSKEIVSQLYFDLLDYCVDMIQ